MDLNEKLKMLSIEDAEYIMGHQNQFNKKVIERAEEVLSNAPYINYSCQICGINWIQRKGYKESKEQLCYKCYVRGL
ncbi:hypothetical protein [Bacillus inaquosorum]|uniref:hypothetical protein n=1 Tax=Bacillus inaquosorum TaxID=483913 RepID=UPI00227F1924|nr:hypothetical protein [Bacillus inaquosorum]MCY8056495.1 hypothetical protein [Bacillus inaquosorum]MCY9397648.1 hypothetical protein [Bacillus inaquosorum]